MLNYLPQSLVIALPCKHPESGHEALITAIITTLKFQMQSNEPITPMVKKGNLSLLLLLETLMPDEHQLHLIHQSNQ